MMILGRDVYQAILDIIPPWLVTERLSGHDGDISDSKVVKIIPSNYSRIIFYIIFFGEPLPQCVTQKKTTMMNVAVYLHYMATRCSCALSIIKMAMVNFQNPIKVKIYKDVFSDDEPFSNPIEDEDVIKAATIMYKQTEDRRLGGQERGSKAPLPIQPKLLYSFVMYCHSVSLSIKLVNIHLI